MHRDRRRPIVATIAFLAFCTQALAHHPMDRRLPGTAFEGLLSGLGHPIIGIDHLAFIVACGIIASAYRQALALTLAFVAASSTGALLHFQGFTIPWPEGAISISLVCFGALIAFRSRLPIGAAAVLFAIAGLFHGYALFESIIGAEQAPLIAYASGLVASQYGVALLTIAGLAFLRRSEVRGLAWGQRAYGAVVAAFGLFTLVSQQIG